MGALFTKLWCDPDYFIKTIVFTIGLAISLLQLVPGDAGTIGWYARLLGTPLLIAIGATSTYSSGITREEAAKLRALIPTKEKLDKEAPPEIATIVAAPK